MTNLRTLGAGGPAVFPVGLGCMGMSQSYGPADETESVATIHRALELGVTLFDTAEVYGPYTNEALLARALAGRRGQAVIATKFGFRIVDGRVDGVDSRPAHIRDVVEQSLRRLRTDYIDLLYQHRADPNTPVADVVGTMGDLVREGKVRCIGLSEVGGAYLRQAHAVHPVAALQSEYSLWERGLELDVLPVARELGITLVPFSPLGRGFLTGAPRRAEDYPEGDYRRTGDPRLQGDNFERNQQAASVVSEVAARTGCTPAQVALAWLLRQGTDIVPIPGTKRRRWLEENVAAVDVTLDPGDAALLDRALPPGSTSGARYGPRMMSYVQR